MFEMFALLINFLILTLSDPMVTCNLFFFSSSRVKLSYTEAYVTPFSTLHIREFAVAICRRILPWEFAAGICRGYLPREFAVWIWHRNLPWLYAVGICSGFFVFVSKSFFVYVSKSCLYGSKPFLYASKTFFFMRFSLFFFVIAVAVMGYRNFKQIFSLVRTCRNCTLEKIVIEGISYLIKQFDTCTCTPQPCMVQRSGCSCCSDLPIERKVMQYQILPLKNKDLGWRNGK